MAITPFSVCRYLKDKKACKKGAALRDVNNLAFLIADTVRVDANKPEVLTKYDHHLTKVLWEIEGSGGEEEEEEKVEDDDVQGGDDTNGKKECYGAPIYLSFGKW